MIMNTSQCSSATPMHMHAQVHSCAEAYMHFSDKHYNISSSPWRAKLMGVPTAGKRNPKDPVSLMGTIGRICVSTHELSKDKEPKGHLNHPTFLPPPSIQLALSKSLRGDQYDKEIEGAGHQASQCLPPLSLGRWSQPSAALDPLTKDAGRKENLSQMLCPHLTLNPAPASGPREAEVPGS